MDSQNLMLMVICGIGLLIVMLALIFNEKFRKDMLAGEGEASLGPVSINGAAVLVLCALLLGGLSYPIYQSNPAKQLIQKTEELKNIKEELKNIKQELEEVTLRGYIADYKEGRIDIVVYPRVSITQDGSFQVPVRSTRQAQQITFQSPHVIPRTFTIVVRRMNNELEIASAGDQEPMKLKIEGGDARIPEPVNFSWIGGQPSKVPPNTHTEQPKPSAHKNVESTPYGGH